MAWILAEGIPEPALRTRRAQFPSHLRYCWRLEIRRVRARVGCAEAPLSFASTSHAPEYARSRCRTFRRRQARDLTRLARPRSGRDHPAEREQGADVRYWYGWGLEGRLTARHRVLPFRRAERVGYGPDDVPRNCQRHSIARRGPVGGRGDGEFSCVPLLSAAVKRSPHDRSPSAVRGRSWGERISTKEPLGARQSGSSTVTQAQPSVSRKKPRRTRPTTSGAHTYAESLWSPPRLTCPPRSLLDSVTRFTTIDASLTTSLGSLPPRVTLSGRALCRRPSCRSAARPGRARSSESRRPWSNPCLRTAVPRGRR